MNPLFMGVVALVAVVCIGTIIHRSYLLLPDPSPTAAAEQSNIFLLPPYSNLSTTFSPTPPPEYRAGNEEYSSISQDELLRFMQATTFPSLTLEQILHTKAKPLWPKHWNEFDWINHPDWKSFVMGIRRIQNDFLAAPKLYHKQPVLYRPILPGMGWGNLVYDISFHAIFAFMLQRPLLILMDLKDPNGALGWNATRPGVLEYNQVDWRWGKQELLDLYPPSEFKSHSSEHFIATCREGTEFNKLCGGDQSRGNFDPLLKLFASHPNKPIYSEFSASFIMPLTNSKTRSKWIETNLCTDRHHLQCQLQFAFSMLFRINSEFRAREILPRVKTLTKDFTSPFAVAHVRTGHREIGKDRGDAQAFAKDLDRLLQCRSLLPDINWLVLTDTAEIATEAVQRGGKQLMVTLDESYTLETSHVGYNIASALAWESTLRDWLLLVESTGPNFMRSRMPSAFSFGERGGLIGGKQCGVKRNALLQCGANFFDKACAFDFNAYFLT